MSNISPSDFLPTGDGHPHYYGTWYNEDEIIPAMEKFAEAKVNEALDRFKEEVKDKVDEIFLD
jgi:hypothetical protein